MKGNRLFTRKTWATILALALALSLALTGTLAWRSISQVARDDFKTKSNPGGRLHDYLNGTANKDVFVENFTDDETGAPIFARVRLLEYMETGDDAGINRDATDRHAKSLMDGAKINDTSTWHVHKPGESATDDPFHNYWEWTYGGSVSYVPTFNKNKDSLTAEINGTYAGKDKNFNTGTPYDDYQVYTVGADVTAIAYYDADTNDKDEYDPSKSGQVPGGGGTEKTAANPKGNYTKKEETHTVQSTLNGLGMLTMQEWKDKGCPVGNFWVWDTDGWAYWAKPIMPQTATGLFLTKVNEKAKPSETSYYSINVVGQFADAFQWGEKDTDDPGFYADGFTDDAKALLDQAAGVKIGQDGNWYLPKGQNVYQQILDDEGNLSDPICAGEDTEIGTPDDNKNVVYVPGGIDIGGKHYGDYFLKPTEDKPYYRAPGADNELGKAPDDRLWVLDGGKFPEDAVNEIADSIVVNPPAGVTLVDDQVPMDAGANAAFTATVTLDGGEPKSDAVVWSVKAKDGATLQFGTKVTDDGILYIDAEETANPLVLTAASKWDNRIIGTKEIKVYGKPYVKLTKLDGTVPTSFRAGETVQLKATLCHSGEAIDPQPDASTYHWAASFNPATRSMDVDNVVIDQSGILKVGRNIAGNTVTVAVTCTTDGKAYAGKLENIPVTDADAVTVTVSEASSATTVDAGGSLTFSADIDKADELATTDVTWSVGSSTDRGATITSVNGVSISEEGVLSVKSDGTFRASNNTVIYVKATPKDTSVGSVYGVSAVTILVPDSVEVTVQDNATASVKQGKALQLKAKVKLGSRDYASHEVDWSLSNNTSTSTTISNGKLQTASDETLGKLKISVTSKVNTNAKDELQVEVSDGILRIDGVEFLVLKVEKDKDRALIITKNLIDNQVFDASNKHWESNPAIRTYLIDWLESHTELNSVALETTIYTRKEISSGTADNDFAETIDKIFLLSEPDVQGTYNMGRTNQLTAKDFTDGVGVLTDPSGQGWRAAYNGTDNYWWLRSPANLYTDSGDIKQYGTYNSASRYLSFGVRPALWIDTTKITLPPS